MSNETFGEFDKDIQDVWLYKLRSSYWKIVAEVKVNSGKNLRDDINFVLEHGMKDGRIGEWRPVTRVIAFEIDLLRNYEWAAVEHVMRHEIAHMIVNDIFDINVIGRPHGEIFNIACKMVGIEEEESGKTSLSAFKGSMESPMVDKIRKLLIHGNDKACTREEAETFLGKAQELMIRHQIKMEEVCGSERFFISRPVGPKFVRLPSWLWSLVDLIQVHYHIKAIAIQTGGYKRQKEYRMEFFGEPSNLDIAEYVFHALLNQGEAMFKVFKVEHTNKCKVDPDYLEKFTSYTYSWEGSKGKGTRNRISQASYFMGLFSGYASKLYKEKKIVEDKIKAEDGSIILIKDEILKEMFNEYYHPRSSKGTAYNLKSNAAYSAGRSAGSNMTLSKGVNSKSNGLQLIA